MLRIANDKIRFERCVTLCVDLRIKLMCACVDMDGKESKRNYRERKRETKKGLKMKWMDG